ncbi:Eukaryotic translation initiation factor 1b [Bagarius yarrelli]|uniref:Eukaryotic translation initiation factor 1b n=1 Tax=Bagarius yarrelli TaxID=175774 RepID=A0A556VWM4_BAGYA|nr:Eukaryotic translation initiation factor 1b [Bagarius yarrelli]
MGGSSCCFPPCIKTSPGAILFQLLKSNQRKSRPLVLLKRVKPTLNPLKPPNRASHPFADATKGDDRLPAGTEDYIHIRIQQRNGRKTLTTVQGIADDYDKKKLVKAFKKKFACNGTVIEHPEYGEVIQLQGDQRKNICQFLTEIELAKEEQLKVHGF